MGTLSRRRKTPKGGRVLSQECRRSYCYHRADLNQVSEGFPIRALKSTRRFRITWRLRFFCTRPGPTRVDMTSKLTLEYVTVVEEGSVRFSGHLR